MLACVQKLGACSHTNLMLWDSSGGHFGAQNTTTSLRFSPWHARILIFFMSPRIGPSASPVSGAPGEPHEGVAHASRSELCFALVWMLAKNVTVATALKICSFAGLSISVCYVRSDSEVRAGMDLCRQYTCFLPASKGSATPSQSKHWSGGCRVCRTCSAVSAIHTPINLWN